MNLHSSAKLNNVQILRAYAAIAVVYVHTGFHFGPLHPLGAFGVDLFFIISGYIMARILDSERTRHFFLRRRLVRIIPPYWFFTLLVFFASILVPHMMVSTRSNIPDLLKSLFFIPFMKGDGIRPMLFVGWSINYEMFFYVALAIGLAIAPRRAVWIGSGIILATVAICSFIAHPGPVVLFYSDPIILEFVMGILGFYICQSIGPIRSTPLKSILMIVGVAAALALSVTEGFHLYFTQYRTVFFGIYAWIAVCASVLLASNGWDSRNKLLILIGDASYILYLIHAFVLDTLDRALAHRFGHWFSNSTLSGMILGITASVIIAILLHVYAERPLLRLLTARFGGHRPPSEFQPNLTLPG